MALPFMAQITAVRPSSSSSTILASTSCGTFTALRCIHSRFPINTSYCFVSAGCLVSMLSNCCSSITCFSWDPSRLWTISTMTPFTLKFPKLLFLHDIHRMKRIKCQTMSLMQYGLIKKTNKQTNNYNTRAVWKVPSHFEYLKNWSRTSRVALT